MKTLARTTALAVLLVAFWLALRWAPVSAQDGADRRLVELVAKVSMNEALDSYDDLALIWQVVEGHGDTDAERVRWLGQHSGCVSGARFTQDEARARPGQCRWTRNLHPDGRRPRGWDRTLHGRWSRMRPRWLVHIDRVRAFVRGRDPYRPCPIAPSSWDGDHPSWRARAEARGWVAVECDGDARNIGYRRAGAS